MRTQNIPFSIQKKKIILIYLKSAAMGFFSKGLKNEFETAVVNEPSVFEPLRFYCTYTKLVQTIFFYIRGYFEMLSVRDNES